MVTLNSPTARLAGGNRQLVYCLRGILLRDPGQSDRVRRLQRGRIEDHSGGDHALGLRCIFRILSSGSAMTLNHVVGFAFIALGAFFVFKGPL
jgi:hypothetical protein